MKTKLMKFATVAVLGMFAVVALPGFALATTTPPPSHKMEDATYSSIDLFTGDLKIDSATGTRPWDHAENINSMIVENTITGPSVGGGNGII